MTSEPVLSVSGLTKSYGAQRPALSGVSFELHAGEVLCVVGENGAGKSTLIKVMAGVVRPDAGTLELSGVPIVLDGPAAAARAGIVTVFQELSLLPDLTVADNICITDPPRRLWKLIDLRAQRRVAEQALQRVGAGDIHPLELVRNLPLSRRQMVEIAKALARTPRILVLDEATSALAAADVESVFRVLKRLRDEGLAIVYISHRMHEVEELADDCSVFRNGRHIATFAAGTKRPHEIIEMMIGREVESAFPPRGQRAPGAAPALVVRGLSWAGRLKNIDLEVRPGEVLGLGGLDGQGQRELLLALFGALRGVTGSVEVDGKPLSLSSPRGGAAAGVALIPEDRKTEGLMLPMSVRDNLTFAALDRLGRLGFIDRHAEDRAVEDIIRLLRIRSDGVSGPVGALSGGNQQKVVVGKWLLTKPRVVLLNDPTRGIDVGTKQEIYQLLRTLADAGNAILFYSTDYAELIGCCDRVLVLYDGAVTGVLEGSAMSERNLVASAHNLGFEAAPAGGGA
jgi:ribose transport system ATP-binding protein